MIFKDGKVKTAPFGRGSVSASEPRPKGAVQLVQGRGIPVRLTA